jgi:hypothetical protein
MNLAADMLSGVTSMSESVKAEKKVWVAPALDALAIERTLSGSIPEMRESQVNIPGTNRGSYPG